MALHKALSSGRDRSYRKVECEAMLMDPDYLDRRHVSLHVASLESCRSLLRHNWPRTCHFRPMNEESGAAPPMLKVSVVFRALVDKTAWNLPPPYYKARLAPALSLSSQCRKWSSVRTSERALELSLLRSIFSASTSS